MWRSRIFLHVYFCVFGVRWSAIAAASCKLGFFQIKLRKISFVEICEKYSIIFILYATNIGRECFSTSRRISTRNRQLFPRGNVIKYTASLSRVRVGIPLIYTRTCTTSALHVLIRYTVVHINTIKRFIVWGRPSWTIFENSTEYCHFIINIPFPILKN